MAWGASARLGRRPELRLVPSASPTEPTRTGIYWGTATGGCSTSQADSAVTVTGHRHTAGLRDLPVPMARGGLAANAHFQAAATIQLPETAVSKASTQVVYIHVPVQAVYVKLGPYTALLGEKMKKKSPGLNAG